MTLETHAGGEQERKVQKVSNTASQEHSKTWRTLLEWRMVVTAGSMLPNPGAPLVTPKMMFSLMGRFSGYLIQAVRLSV